MSHLWMLLDYIIVQGDGMANQSSTLINSFDFII